MSHLRPVCVPAVLLAAVAVLLAACGAMPVDADGGASTGGGGALGGGSATGGGATTGGGSALGGGSATGGGTSTGGGSAVGGGSATGGGGGVGGGTATAVTFCDVDVVLRAQCSACHGQTPNAGAPHLVTAADLRSTSPNGGTYLDRSLTRMQTTPVSGAMPPGVGGSANDISVLSRWRVAGTPDCAANTGGGTATGGGSATGGGTAVGGGSATGGGAATGGGGGTAPETCASNLTWFLGNSLGASMNPGEACAACHARMGRGPVDGFMGTVYPALHEKALCVVSTVPANTTVEILDMSGTVRQTFTISGLGDGNFHGGSVGVPSPYRARIKVGGVTRSEMMGAQTSGDCNSCHTSQGAQGAPGRLHW